MFCNLGKSKRALTSWLGKEERSKEQQSVAVGTLTHNYTTTSVMTHS